MSWRDTRRMLRWVFAIGVVALVALQMSVSAQPADDDVARPHDALKIDLEAEVDGEHATFRWRFDGNPENVTCTIDPDGDAILDISIEDCDQRDEVEFLYDEPGVYFAEILARSRDGRSGRAVERVEVR